MAMPAAFVDEYGADFLRGLSSEMLAGLRVQWYARAALTGKKKPVEVANIIHKIEKPRRAHRYDNPVKIWPALGLAAIQGAAGAAGAWRVWTFARAVDALGSGRLLQRDLLAYLDKMSVNRRTGRRWLSDAARLGLLKLYRGPHGKTIMLTGAGRVAVVLGCQTIGKAAQIEGVRLAGKGWRKHVWCGWLVQNNGKLISQKTKRNITGIAERTQRKYQLEAPGRAVRNVRRVTGENANVIRQNPLAFLGAYYYIDSKNQVIQKLPDSRIVYADGAKRTGSGRTAKIQNYINANLSSRDIVPRDKMKYSRIFCKSLKAAEKLAQHRRKRNDKTLGDIFYQAHRGSTSRWEMLTQQTEGGIYAVLLQS